jgi:capsid protein
MIRRHLDFVGDFSFHAATKDKAFNDRLARLFGAWSRKNNCDPARRHPLRRLLRIAEASRTLDGDLLWVKLRRGQVQLIRGDRLRNPMGQMNTPEWRHGARVDRNNAAIEWAVHRRTPFGQMVFERMVPARNVIHHGYFDDPDQVRGVSPMTSALLPLQDVYENFEHALARMKLSNLLGLQVVHKAQDLDGPDYFARPGHDDAGAVDLDEEAEDEEDDDGKRYELDFGRGPWVMEMEKGDELKLVESNMPSANFQAFSLDVLLGALKALDLPFSFYREDFTNFFGSRGALQLYRRSARQKQEDNRDVLDELTAWKVRCWIADGSLVLPLGWTIDDVAWEWVARGIEWWDKEKEIRGDVLAIQNGLDTPQRICRDHGSGSYEDNVRDIGEALELSNEVLGPLGMVMGFATPLPGSPPPPPGAAAADDDDEGDEGDELGEQPVKPAKKKGAAKDGATAND